jgi:hypothetical protein
MGFMRSRGGIERFEYVHKTCVIITNSHSIYFFEWRMLSFGLPIERASDQLSSLHFKLYPGQVGLSVQIFDISFATHAVVLFVAVGTDRQAFRMHAHGNKHNWPMKHNSRYPANRPCTQRSDRSGPVGNLSACGAARPWLQPPRGHKTQK